MSFDKHKVLVKALKTQSGSKFHANNEQKAFTSSNSSVKQKKVVSRFAIPTAARKAEVLLAMQSVTSHISHNSMNNFGELFKVMFPDSEMRQKWK